MEKVNEKSINMVDENIKLIESFFPNVVCDGKINWKSLKEEFGEYEDSNDEFYQFTWNGKSEAKKFTQISSNATLLPCKEKSVDWNNTENLYIEGDNLEVLKLLQKSYNRKIKMIYIDPPYNTGNDFVYRDNYFDSIANYKVQTNQVFKANPETSGRFHTDWLNMMYPRIILSKNLLTDNGVLYVSIDEHEIHNLLKIITEVFGNDNYDILVWRKNDKQGNTKVINRFRMCHEYIVVAYKNKATTNLGKLKTLPDWQSTGNPDNDPRGNWMSGNISKEEGKSRKDSPNYYSVVTPSGRIVTREWFITKEEYEKLANDIVINSDGNKVSRIYFASDGLGVPRIKRFENEEQEFYFDSIIDSLGSFTEAHNYLKELFDEKDYFPTPKPVKMIQELIRISTSANDIILDFFAGSSTTAEAVLRINSEDNSSNRRYILVQLPEKISEIEDAFTAGYNTICDIGEKRIILAERKIENENKKIESGFKTFKLDSSNIKIWNSENLDISNANKYFYEHIDPIVDGRTKEDLLYEILLKEGIMLSSKIEEKVVDGKTVYSIDNGYMIVCLEDNIDINLIRLIGKLKPKTVIFKDSGFADENAKANALQELKKLGIEEQRVKSI